MLHWSMAYRRHRMGLGQARITKGALWLLFVSTGLSLLFLVSNEATKIELARWLAASPTSLWHDFKLWQIVTSPLLEPDFVSLLFQGFMLWMFLPALERWWGTRRFLLFALYTSVAGVVAGTLVGLALSVVPASVFMTGLDPFIFASIVAYGVLFASQPVSFFGVLPMTGRQLTIGIVAFMGLFIVLGQQWAQGAANAAAMLLAYLMVSGRASPKLLWLKAKQKRARRRLKLVKSDREPKRWVN